MYQRMPEGMRHAIVGHSRKKWVPGNVHTGTIDAYWGLLKRAVLGNFHRTSMRHVSRRLSEAEYRWNHRDEDLFAVVIIRLLLASAMQYKALTAAVLEGTDNGPEVEFNGEPS